MKCWKKMKEVSWHQAGEDLAPLDQLYSVERSAENFGEQNVEWIKEIKEIKEIKDCFVIFLPRIWTQVLREKAVCSAKCHTARDSAEIRLSYQTIYIRLTPQEVKQIWRIVGVTSFQECRFLSKLSLGSFTLYHTSVVPARGGAEVALRLSYTIRPFSSIDRTYVGCAQPRPMPECFRRICCTVVVKVRTRTRTSCNATPSDTLRSEGHTWNSTLHTAHFISSRLFSSLLVSSRHMSFNFSTILVVLISWKLLCAGGWVEHCTKQAGPKRREAVRSFVHVLVNIYNIL